MSRIARQHIEFPPYLVKARSSGKIFVADICCRSSQAPPEWREKIPVLWSKVKESFGVRDCSEAGGGAFYSAGPSVFLMNLSQALYRMAEIAKHSGSGPRAKMRSFG